MFFTALLPIPRLPAPPNASATLRRVVDRYASVRTYLDEGRVTFSYQSSRGEFTGEQMNFRTWYKRGFGIRLQFTHPGIDGARPQTWQTWKSPRGGFVLWSSWSPGEADRPGLAEAFDASVGMIDVVRIAVGGWVGLHADPPVFKLSKPSLSWSARLDDRRCFIVSGRRTDGARESLWVDQRSYLVRRCRVEVPSSLDGKPTIEVCTVDLKPQANVAFNDASCRFTPPHIESHHRSRRHRKILTKHKKRHRS